MNQSSTFADLPKNRCPTRKDISFQSSSVGLVSIRPGIRAENRVHFLEISQEPISQACAEARQAEAPVRRPFERPENDSPLSRAANQYIAGVQAAQKSKTDPQRELDLPGTREGVRNHAGRSVRGTV